MQYNAWFLGASGVLIIADDKISSTVNCKTDEKRNSSVYPLCLVIENIKIDK